MNSKFIYFVSDSKSDGERDSIKIMFPNKSIVKKWNKIVS